MADLLVGGVEQRRDLEAFLPEARIVGERQAEVAGAHDGDAQPAIEAEDLPQVAAQLLDVVADAADAELAEVREVLPDLRGVEMELLGERLRGDRLHAGGVELVEAPQVHGEPVGGELGDLIGRLLPLVRPIHKVQCYHLAPWPQWNHRYVPASQSPAEFTAKAIVLGILFGLLFGASTVYLGLRAGLTVSASIPIAVLAISVLKRFGGSTILENNIVQTIGSAGESVAGGVVFTIPALIFLVPFGPAYFNYLQITMLTFAGGILGVLMMVPLRRALIVKEHGVLPYPEGTACAEVLVAGERGGKLAALVFGGLGDRRAVEGAVVDLQPVPHRNRLRDAAHQPVSERDARRRHLARVSSASATSSDRASPGRWSPAACWRGWGCCRCCRFSASTSPSRFRRSIRTSRSIRQPAGRS